MEVDPYWGIYGIHSRQVAIFFRPGVEENAAFDTIDHNIMFSRLSDNFGITGVALQWQKSYLSNHKPCVVLSGTIMSDVSVLKYGVHQGSCLGPILFTEYPSSLFQVIYGHFQDAHSYADDNQLYLAFCQDSIVSQQNAVECMENCLCDVKQWMLANKLKMNYAKTEFIITIFHGLLAWPSV